MIDRLKFPKSGNFFRRNARLPKSAISKMFRRLRQESLRPSKPLFCHIRQELDGATWSAISFFHAREPSFLELPANHKKERVCGFLMLVEYRNHIAVFKSGLDLPSAFRTTYLRPVGADRVEAVTARATATFELIRLRNMSASKHSMRSKTLEADDLRTVVSPSGTGRYAPSAFRTREEEVHYSATPNTGRIAIRSEKVGHKSLVSWAAEVIERLLQSKIELSDFIKNFARPMDLSSLPPDLHPVSVGIDVAALTEAVFELPASIRITREHGATYAPLTKPELDALLTALSQNVEVRRVRGEFRLIDPRNARAIGEIRLGKSRVQLKHFRLPEIDGLVVERLDAGGGVTERVPLTRYLDQENVFAVLFNRIDVMYLDGALFRDPSLASGGNALLSYIRAVEPLATTTSEKGEFSDAHTEFDHASVFSVVANALSSPEEHLACDDLGDEWADFIGVSADSQPCTVTFYHAKHGTRSLSASAFHISVSQAIKNLQHLRFTALDAESKRQKWSSNYTNDGHQTLIQRMIRGSFNDFQDAVKRTVAFPDTIRRVLIVTDSLSRQDLVDTLEAAKEGVQPPAHFVQLYSLLMGFFSACAEVGAFPAIVTRP